MKTTRRQFVAANVAGALAAAATGRASGAVAGELMLDMRAWIRFCGSRC